VAGPFLHAKRHWFERETSEAIARLEEITGPLELDEGSVARGAGMPFEVFVAGVLADDLQITLPFATVAGRMWAAFPGSYAIDALVRRGAADPGDLEWLYAAAGDGLLSSDPADYELVARIVVPETLPGAVDRDRLEALMASAEAAEAWEAFVATHADLVANLLLDRAFYAARVMDASMVRFRLDRIAAAQPRVAELAAAALAGWDAEEVVRVGMRSDGPPDCRDELVEALRGGDFDELSSDCLPQ
jgi:hypothetical protein